MIDKVDFAEEPKQKGQYDEAVDEQAEGHGQGEGTHDRKRFETNFYESGSDQSKDAVGGEGNDEIGYRKDERIKAFPKTQLGGPSLFRQFRDEKTEEQAEEDQTEQLSFHGRLEKIGRYHAMKDFEDTGPPFVRLVQGALDLR